MKAKSIEKIVWSVFFVLGLCVFIGGVVACFYVFDYSDKIETTAIITSIKTYGSGDDKTHKVFVSYEVDGVEYESRLNGYSSSYYEGKRIKIYYDKEDPSKIGSKSLNFLYLMFPAFGLIFGGLGAGGLISIYKKKKLERTLRANGQKIFATYSNTSLNRGYSVNGQHPFIVTCEWCDPIDNQTYFFKSKNIWFDPEPTLANKETTYIPVYIDKNNKEKYVVDIESIFGDIDD